MNLPKTIPVADTIATLDKVSAAVLNTALEGAKHCFAKEGECIPVIIAVPEHGDPHVFKAAHRNDQEKEIVWAQLRMLRATHPVVALVNEIWMAKAPPGCDENHLPRPSECDDREEAVMISLWIGKRTIVIKADIHRNPNSLGEFETFSDPMFPVPGMCDSMKGALMDGEPYKGGEEN